MGDRCACPTTDPVQCIRWRYPDRPYWEAEESPCECACHYEDDDLDDWQDEDWTGHPDLGEPREVPRAR